MLFAPTSKRLPNVLYEHYHRSVLQLMHCKQQLHAKAAKREAFKLDLDSKGATSIDSVSSSASSSVPCEIVEIMMKLDAKIVSYLAGDTVSSSDEQLALQCLKTTSSPLDQLVGKIAKDRVDTFHEVARHERAVADASALTGHHIDGIRLHIEALTLQPEGTKRMELLQNEMRPIFTVECQLSNDLIEHVARYDMFNVMQFESEKFHSLTQCTRFGQELYRDIKLSASAFNSGDRGAGQVLSCGQLSFTVWWREPGTCLNEMLGMGRLNLRDMCNASLLEQCKCISIYKRQTHLASLYMKISLKSQVAIPRTLHGVAIDGDNNNQAMHKNGTGGQPQPQQQQQQANSGDNKFSTSSFGGAMSANSDEHVQGTNNNNNNLHVQSGDFSNETSKVRLLKGFICASELRNLDLNGSQDYELVLVCRRFWQEEVTAITTQEDGNNFNYQEQFAVINDEKFLKRAEKQYLILEFWQRLKDTSAPNSNGGPAIVPVGIARLPMHQFYIAYRDAAITNHLCNGKLPVVSFDAWAPITRSAASAGASSASGSASQTLAGEIKCLLAIGSEEQISHLKSTKGLPANTHSPANALDSKGLHDLLNSRKSMAIHEGHDSRAAPLQRTADLMDMLQRKLATQQPAAAAPPDSKLFQFILNVRQARDLPLNASTGSAKGSKKAAKRNTNAMKRFPPNEAPSAYVTFQAAACHATSYKSHEGDVYATHIVAKSTQPHWANTFRVTASREYLSNARKRFIVKIWKKSNSPTTAPTMPTAPTPLDDAIIGFAAIDLTPLGRGYNVTDWYNVVDFNGRINGQLEVECCALCDGDGVMGERAAPTAVPQLPTEAGATAAMASIDAALAQFESSLQLGPLNLGQAIKRKFDELEEISQRLRSRLGDVTGEALPAAGATAFDMSSLDNWKSLETVLDGEEFLLHDDFERDIATPTEMGANSEHNEANAQTKQL